MKKVSIKMVKEEVLDYGIDSILKPEDAWQVLKNYIDEMDREVFVVICLDIRNHINAINTVSIGNLNSSLVHPREVFKPAILANAAAIILGHNHPSGDPNPSKEDIQTTKQMAAAGKILGIDVLDHVIIGDNIFYSLKANGDL